MLIAREMRLTCNVAAAVMTVENEKCAANVWYIAARARAGGIVRYGWRRWPAGAHGMARIMVSASLLTRLQASISEAEPAFLRNQMAASCRRLINGDRRARRRRL